jgi:hypothetical protein
MDREAIRDCQFLERCATFGDPMIDQGRKGPAGMGCTGQNDIHRSRHCHVFRCTCLCVLLGDLLGGAGHAKPRKT